MNFIIINSVIYGRMAIKTKYNTFSKIELMAGSDEPNGGKIHFSPL